MAHDVFICHSAKDKALANEICAFLEARNIRCWVAPRDITPGTDWGEAIITALETARLMVLVFSSHANDSPQVKREVQRAFEKESTVVSLRCENAIRGGVGVFGAERRKAGKICRRLRCGQCCLV